MVGRLLRDHRAGRLPGIIGADRLWSFAYVDDVALAHVRAVERADASGEYAVGGENAPQIRLFEIATRIAGGRVPRRIPLALARFAGLLNEAGAGLFNRPPFITRGAVEIFSHHWRMDSGRSIRELNYRITPLEKGIRHTLEAAASPLHP